MWAKYEEIKKIHDCQPILENYRRWLLKFVNISFFF